MIVRQLSNVAILSLPAAASIERKPFNQQNLACSSVADVLRGDFKQPSSTASSCHSLHYGDGNACWSLNTAIEAIGQQCENPESQDSGFFYACDLIPLLYSPFDTPGFQLYWKKPEICISPRRWRFANTSSKPWRANDWLYFAPRNTLDSCSPQSAKT